MFCNYIVRHTLLDSLFHLLVTEDAIVWNFKRQSSSLVPHSQISHIFDKKQSNELIVSESERFVQGIVSKLIALIPLLLDQLWFFLDLKVFVQEKSTHKILISFDSSHKW